MVKGVGGSIILLGINCELAAPTLPHSTSRNPLTQPSRNMGRVETDGRADSKRGNSALFYQPINCEF